MEGTRHVERVQEYIREEESDVICLMEAPWPFCATLHSLGYQTAFSPTTYRHEAQLTAAEGVIIATRQPALTFECFYHKPTSTPLVYDTSDRVGTSWRSVLFADVTIGGESFLVATTHFTWTPDGAVPNEAQQRDLPRLQEILRSHQPHILCGDLNLPRGINPLATELLRDYTDAVPTHYTSSLDRDLHRLAEKPELAHLFTDYMVDYLLLQAPYTAQDVRLQFGVSDHAAVIARLHRGE